MGFVFRLVVLRPSLAMFSLFYVLMRGSHHVGCEGSYKDPLVVFPGVDEQRWRDFVSYIEFLTWRSSQGLSVDSAHSPVSNTSFYTYPVASG